jgi:hypothetical protein
MFYNASAELDRLICDMLDSYVIEVDDLSRVFPTAPPGMAYFGVWNIFRALDATASSLRTLPGAAVAATNGNDLKPLAMFQLFDQIHGFQSDHLGNSSADFGLSEADLGNSECNYRRFELTEILKSPQAVMAFSRNIQLHQATTWRLDRTLFDKWPELKFDGYEKVVAKGRSYRIPSESPQAPTEMTAPIMKAYQEAIQDVS